MCRKHNFQSGQVVHHPMSSDSSGGDLIEMRYGFIDSCEMPRTQSHSLKWYGYFLDHYRFSPFIAIYHCDSIFPHAQQLISSPFERKIQNGYRTLGTRKYNFSNWFLRRWHCVLFRYVECIVFHSLTQCYQDPYRNLSEMKFPLCFIDLPSARTKLHSKPEQELMRTKKEVSGDGNGMRGKENMQSNCTLSLSTDVLI